MIVSDSLLITFYPCIPQIIFFYSLFSYCQGPGLVKIYECPGIHALNFVLESSLGGGGIASLRPDPQVNIRHYVLWI